MREAAVKAGLVEHKANLVIALEPEAACITAESDAPHLKAGDEFMILDCGGGTVDITLHKTKSTAPLRLDELEPPSGGAWGSTIIDSEFTIFLRDLMTTFRKPNQFMRSSHYVELMQKWEALKLSFDPKEERGGSLSLSDVLEFGEVGEMKVNDMVDSHNRTRHTDIKIRGKSTIILPKNMMIEFFDAVITPIKNHVARLLLKHNLKYIFLVGGFGESTLLEDRIKTAFGTERLKIITQLRPGLAVLRGAVKFGFSEQTFFSRKARFSYGIESSNRLDSLSLTNLAEARRRGTITAMEDGVKHELADNVFSLILRAGTSIECGEKVTKSGYSGINDGQKEIRFDLYSYCRAGEPFWTDDPGCTKIGSITIPISDRTDSVSVTLEFGSTEIKISCWNTATDMRVDAKLDYGFGTV